MNEGNNFDFLIIDYNKLELQNVKKDEPKMKSNKRIIDEEKEKEKYLTKNQEINGTLENLRLKNIKENKLRESRMKVSKETTQRNPVQPEENFDDVITHKINLIS